MSYTQQELAHFKVLVEEKIKASKEELDLLIQESSLDNNGTDDTYRSAPTIEEGFDVLPREEKTSLIEKQQKLLQQLQFALIRIQNDTYGYCYKSGKQIPKERLLACLHITTTIEEEKKLNKQININIGE
jgi:DnaK suppressor protein